MTERRKPTRTTPPRPPQPADDAPRPFPELSRHFKPTDEVYNPDSATWLRQPSPRTGRNRSGKTSGPPGTLPPKGGHGGKKGSSGPSPFKIGGVFLVCVVIVGLAIERFEVATGDPKPTPTVPATAVIEPTALEVATPLDTPTATATPTDIPPTSTPTAVPTPTATATPDPRFIGKVVCLDPGHGGTDRGFIRKGNAAAPEMEEGFYNLAFARALKLRLEAHGFTVVMTRTEDVDVNADFRDVNGDGETIKKLPDPTMAERVRLSDEIQARINICNDADASLLVSLHINGFTDPQAEGYETWYSGARNDADASKLFAEIAVEAFGKAFADAGYNARLRGANNDDHANASQSEHSFKHYLIIGPAQEGIVPSAMPGAIIEVGFLSNDADAAFMRSNEGRNTIVTAYEQAIVRYFVTISEEFVYGAK